MRNLSPKNIKAKLIFVALSLLMAGCYTSKDCICPAYYSPVCGENGKTYENPCAAECDEVSYIDGECPVYGVGVVQFSGDTLCGHYISVLGDRYKPRNLPVQYREHNLAVAIRYRKMNSWFTCDAPYEVLQELDVLEISKITN